MNSKRRPNRRRCLQTLATALVLALALTSPADAAIRIGFDVSSAFAYATACVQWESLQGNRLSVSVPASGDGLGLSYRRCASQNGFGFYAGPEIVVAGEQHPISVFAGYGFSYVLEKNPAQAAFHVSVGLADGPSLAEKGDLRVSVGSRDLTLGTILGLKILLSL